MKKVEADDDGADGSCLWVEDESFRVGCDSEVTNAIPREREREKRGFT